MCNKLIYLRKCMKIPSQHALLHSVNMGGLVEAGCRDGSRLMLNVWKSCMSMSFCILFCKMIEGEFTQHLLCDSVAHLYVNIHF